MTDKLNDHDAGEAGNFEMIPSCPGYAVSDDGRVFSMRRRGGAFLSGTVCSDGYVRVGVRCADGVRRMVAVHRLVAEVFVPNPQAKPLVNHKNGIKTWNVASNLEWVTARENVVHANATGLNSNAIRGAGHPRSHPKATLEAVGERRAKGSTYTEIANELGCSLATVFSRCEELSRLGTSTDRKSLDGVSTRCEP